MRVDDAAVEAANVKDASGLEGSSFVAVQRWVHDLGRFRSHPQARHDAIIDALFSFSRPIRGGYYWCPPIADGRLDPSRLLR